MRLLVIIALVASASALPRKSTKIFPKKFVASLDGGIKDTYANYETALSKGFVVPAESPFLDSLLPPSSYGAYFEQEPQDFILPPEGSTYTGVNDQSEGEALVPPPVDSYSSVHTGSSYSDLVPPPVSRKVLTDQESYMSYSGDAQEALVAPILSSYAEYPKGRSGAEVLASLAAMAQSLPLPNSYDSYEPVITREVAASAPLLMLRPPSGQEMPELKHSSYSEMTMDQEELTAALITAAQEAGIPIPTKHLTPPFL